MRAQCETASIDARLEEAIGFLDFQRRMPFDFLIKDLVLAARHGSN